MQPQWIVDFVVTDDDIEFLNTLLLEREIPQDSETLARSLVEKRIQQEAERLQERFKDAQPYDPARAYDVGQRLVFPSFDYSIGNVVDKRPGDNSEYGEFDVIAVDFEDPALNTSDTAREFASSFPLPHTLNLNGDNDDSLAGLPMGEELDIEEIVNSSAFDDIIDAVDRALEEDDALLNVAGEWFPVDLMVETNEGHMHLAEAVLDMMGGGPMTTREVLENIGGLGEDVRLELQVFSMNWGMNQDDRFDEVGPAGEVLWYLRRMEPEQVQHTPEMLRYEPIQHNRELLSPRALQLEAELMDEHSPLPLPAKDIEEARAVIIYPHRRVGTLPLNHQMQRIFPTARKTDHVAVTLVDAGDDETFPAWVVRNGRYVQGLAPLYTKYALPIGTTVRLRRGNEPGHYIIAFDTYKPRSEWITIVTANNGQIGFETAQRAIGATYDDLLLLGVDDLDGVDKLFQGPSSRQQPLATILRMLIPLLGGITAQGHVHAKTLYSVVNVVRRCPPGPILATLSNNPDFENVGEHYWRLSGSG